MSFERTSEGRVFFKNADNDDVVRPMSAKTSAQPKPQNAKPTKQAAPTTTERVLPKDTLQMQTLMLLKFLNTKLKESKDERTSIKKQLDYYKNSIKSLQDNTAKNQSDYIDLEQKISVKQSEVSKKSSRVEEHVKTAMKKLDLAKELVETLEEQTKSQDESLKSLKDEVAERKASEDKLSAKQAALEKLQKEQGEKMVSSVATYVALTKRVSEAEAQSEALDNKIENATSEYLKLDRKIDRVIEDRNRILRKVERIEQAVLETRDALNSKAMVLLTDQGAVAGVNMPQLEEGALQTDPLLLQRRLQEEAMMPWWRRPVRINATSLALICFVVALSGWILSTMQRTQPTTQSSQDTPPTVSLYTPEAAPKGRTSPQEETVTFSNNLIPAEDEEMITLPPETQEKIDTAPPVETQTAYGITIHKGAQHAEDLAAKKPLEDRLDVTNEAQMLQTMERAPQRVAKVLNDIEPGSLTTGDKQTPALKTTKPEIAAAPVERDLATYKAALKTRIQQDPSLSDVAKKIETQAFNGVAEAQHDMGAIYVAGHGQVQQNLDRAVLWFTEAANNGVANAKYNLGVLYHQGMGVEKNVSKAMTLYKEAADLDHPEAQYNLGIANIEGIGVPYNAIYAAGYFENAAKQGITEAAYNLGLIYENGLLGEVRPDVALAWYKRAADAGSSEAQSALNQLAKSLSIDMDDVENLVASFENAQSQNLISDVQEQLMQRGLYPGPVDGKIGPMTRSAIEAFQKSAGLDVTGEASQTLLNYLSSRSQ